MRSVGWMRGSARCSEVGRLTAGFLAWGAQTAAAGGLQGAGALGPVDAFGLDELERGCAEAGIARV